LEPRAGDDDILRDMGRGHTVEAYMKIIDRIRTLIPDASITADCIVGFPGALNPKPHKPLAPVLDYSV